MPTFVFMLALLIFVPASLGGLAYYLLAILFTHKKRIAGRQNELHRAADSLPAITLLKPLRGADTTMGACLTSFFEQDYPAYEILFAVRQADDPAVVVAKKLMYRFPYIPARILFTGEPPYANAKVFSMEKMEELARHEILVITDSDTSVAPDYLRDIARIFANPEVGALTHLYRGIAGEDLWSKLEALGMSTEFMAGVVVAERLEGMKFALGPSMAIRRDCLQKIGGFAAMADYLADDFVLGNWADRAGYRVVLSCEAISHHATATGFLSSFRHRLRWNRSTRCSRPAGYAGQGFTYGLCWAALLTVCSPAWWSLALLTAVAFARVMLAWELSRLLGDPEVMRRIWLLPFQDLLSFASWIGGFSGREIVWRNERYRLLSDGRFEPLTPRPTQIQTKN